MKVKITLKLDANIVRDARLLAAEKGLSVSALLTAKFEEVARQRKACHSSRKRALARLRKGFDLGWTPPRSRNELHNR